MTMTGERCADCPFVQGRRETIAGLEAAGKRITTRATSNGIDDYAESIVSAISSQFEVEGLDPDEFARNLRMSAAAQLDTLDEAQEVLSKQIDDATSTCDEPLRVLVARNGILYTIESCTSPNVAPKSAPFEAFVDDNNYLKYVKTVGSAATRVTRTEDYSD